MRGTGAEGMSSSRTLLSSAVLLVVAGSAGCDSAAPEPAAVTLTTSRGSRRTAALRRCTARHSARAAEHQVHPVPYRHRQRGTAARLRPGQSTRKNRRSLQHELLPAVPRLPPAGSRLRRVRLCRPAAAFCQGRPALSRRASGHSAPRLHARELQFLPQRADRPAGDPLLASAAGQLPPVPRPGRGGFRPGEPFHGVAGGVAPLSTGMRPVRRCTGGVAWLVRLFGLGEQCRCTQSCQ